MPRWIFGWSSFHTAPHQTKMVFQRLNYSTNYAKIHLVSTSNAADPSHRTEKHVTVCQDSRGGRWLAIPQPSYYTHCFPESVVTYALRGMCSRAYSIDAMPGDVRGDECNVWLLFGPQGANCIIPHEDDLNLRMSPREEKHRVL